MSDNVTSITGVRGQHGNPRRTAFAETVAAAFDTYVADFGVEPETIVFVLNGLTQESHVSWHITGASEKGATSVLCYAAVHLLAEAQASRFPR